MILFLLAFLLSVNMGYAQRLTVRYHHEHPRGFQAQKEKPSEEEQPLFEDFEGDSEMMKEPLLLMNSASGHFETSLTLNFPEGTILSVTLEVGSEKIVAGEGEMVSLQTDQAADKDGQRRLSHKLQVKVPPEMAAKASGETLKTMTMVVNTE